MKPDLRRNRAGEQREAAGDQARISAIRPHRLDQGAAAGREGDAARHDLVDDADRQALQQGDALSQGGLEGDLAIHRALRNGRNLGLQADEIGEFVDAFLPDHGGIHVGEKKALAALGDGLDHEVDRARLRSRPSGAPR